MKRSPKAKKERELDSKVLTGKAKCAVEGHDLDRLYKLDERYQACPRCGDQFDMRDMEKSPYRAGWFKIKHKKGA